MKRYIELIKFELALELKARKLIVSAVAQVAAFVLVIYFGLHNPQGVEWTTFFWLITLFASMSGLSRSFLQTQKGLNLYLYQIVSSKEFFVVRTFSNFIYILLVGLSGIVLLYLFYGFVPIPFLPLLLLCLLSAIGFSAIFTFTGSIASGANNAAVLLPLLSVPLLIPLLMVLFTASDLLLIPGASIADIYPELLLLGVLDILFFLPGLLLFPQMWGE